MTVDIQLHFCFDVVERVAGQRMHSSIDCTGEHCASRDERDSGERESEKERECARMTVCDEEGERRKGGIETGNIERPAMPPSRNGDVRFSLCAILAKALFSLAPSTKLLFL